MKSLTLALSLLLVAQVNATSLLKVLDGSKAKCLNARDVFDSKMYGTFSLGKPVVLVEESEVSVELRINFLECQKVGTEFKFVKVNYTSESEVEFMDNIIKKVELEKEIRVYSEERELLSKGDIISQIENEGSHTIKLAFSKNAMNVNDFSASSSKGDSYVLIDMKTTRVVTSGSYNSGKETMISGQYRLFIDTKNNKALLE